jgi:hypothetical protein
MSPTRNQQEFIIYCDESESKGRIFSNFYGGALIRSQDLDSIRLAIAEKKKELNFFGEVKWSKISVNYSPKYIALIDFFFDLIKADKVKIRIMFTENRNRPHNLSKEQYDNQYAILYYFFIRHAFGLSYSPRIDGGAKVRVYADEMPFSATQFASFKSHVTRLTDRSEFWSKGISFEPEDITEVRSHDHDVLQCLDVILGAMNFRLTGKHLDKPEGQKQRSAKTLAKLRVYNRINKHIREIYPNFNIGITTGHQGDWANRWNHRYRHWNFSSKK